MIQTGEIELIDKNELIEVLARCDCSSMEKVMDIIVSRPVIAVAKHRYEIREV